MLVSFLPYPLSHLTSPSLGFLVGKMGIKKCPKSQGGGEDEIITNGTEHRHAGTPTRHGNRSVWRQLWPACTGRGRLSSQCLPLSFQRFCLLEGDQERLLVHRDLGQRPRAVGSL